MNKKELIEFLKNNIKFESWDEHGDRETSWYYREGIALVIYNDETKQHETICRYELKREEKE